MCSYFKQLLVMAKKEKKDLQKTVNTILVSNQEWVEMKGLEEPLRTREIAAEPPVPQLWHVSRASRLFSGI